MKKREEKVGDGGEVKENTCVSGRVERAEVEIDVKYL